MKQTKTAEQVLLEHLRKDAEEHAEKTGSEVIMLPDEEIKSFPIFHLHVRAMEAYAAQRPTVAPKCIHCGSYNTEAHTELDYNEGTEPTTSNHLVEYTYYTCKDCGDNFNQPIVAEEKAIQWFRSLSPVQQERILQATPVAPDYDCECVRCNREGHAKEWHTVGLESHSGYGADPICDECYKELIGEESPVADTDDLQAAATRYQDNLLQEGNAGNCAIEDHFKIGAQWEQMRAAQHPDRLHAIEGLEYALKWAQELRPTTPGMGRFMTVIQFAINYLNNK